MREREGFRRAMARAAVALIAFFVGMPGARAEEKKKPGMFDFQTWKTPQGHQADALKQLEPVRLDLTPATTAHAEPRTLRLRIYADSDYRSTVLHWQRGIRGQIVRVNHVLEAVFNVRFELEALRPWPASHAGAALDAIVTELEALDPAREVDFVVGLATPFRGVATSVHQIGWSHLLARHFVLRGMDDEQESLALDREFNLLDNKERQRIYSDRKDHKETVVFLHELGHALGALHEEGPAAIMNPGYDASRAAFTPFEKELLTFVLQRRLDSPGEQYPESEGLLALLQRAPADEGSDKERAALLVFAQQRAPYAAATHGATTRLPQAPSATGPAPEPSALARPTVRLDLPAADVATYNHVAEALTARKLEEAWTLLQPLARKYPTNMPVTSLACALVAGHPRGAEARAVCDSALASGRSDAAPLLDAADAYLNAKDPTSAALFVAKAQARVAATDQASWLRLATLASATGALSTADAAVGHVDRDNAKAPALIEAIEEHRMRVALPRDAARWNLAPEREAAYVSAFVSAEALIGTGDLPAARMRVRELARDFPDCPGVDVLECELELGARHFPAASKRCESAVTKFGQATRALYLLGFLAARGRQTDDAQKYLRKALLLDPRNPDPWRELARLYRATHASQRLADLEAQHQALLSSPLPQ